MKDHCDGCSCRDKPDECDEIDCGILNTWFVRELIDRNGRTVEHWKGLAKSAEARVEELEAEVERLRALVGDVYLAAINVPIVYRGDALRWASLCDRMLEEIGEDPMVTAFKKKD